MEMKTECMRLRVMCGTYFKRLGIFDGFFVAVVSAFDSLPVLMLTELLRDRPCEVVRVWARTGRELDATPPTAGFSAHKDGTELLFGMRSELERVRADLGGAALRISCKAFSALLRGFLLVGASLQIRGLNKQMTEGQKTRDQHQVWEENILLVGLHEDGSWIWGQISMSWCAHVIYYRFCRSDSKAVIIRQTMKHYIFGLHQQMSWNWKP